MKTFVADHWTLEYDLACASEELAGVMLAACRLAHQTATHTWPDDGSAAEFQAARREVAEVIAAGGNLADLALASYRLLLEGPGSKSIAAQFAAGDIALTPLRPEQLPSYLRDAFAFVTAERSGESDH